MGAELRNLVNEAALTAARRDRAAVAKADFSEAMEKIVLGAARRLVMTPADRARVAWHESGHALLGLLLPEADPVQKVTIVPRGQALGVTWQAPPDDRHNYAEADLRARIAGALGAARRRPWPWAPPPPGPRTTCSRPPPWPARWSPAGACPPAWAPSTPPARTAASWARPATCPTSARESATSWPPSWTRRRGGSSTSATSVAEDTLRRERWRLEALATALLERESLDEEEIRQVTGLPGRAKRPAEGTGAGSRGEPGREPERPGREPEKDGAAVTPTAAAVG